MAASAAAWLSIGFGRLVADVDWLSAYDVKLRHEEVTSWFAGMPVYEEMRDAVYPPASYALLWPLLGWLDLQPARWLWAAGCAGALAWLRVLCRRAASPLPARTRFLAWLLPLALWSTGRSIGQGQLVVLVLPALLAGVGSAAAPPRRLEVPRALALLFALMKPTLAAPFAALGAVLRPRVVLLAAAAYAALTVLAASYQDAPLPDVIAAWLRRGVHVAALQGDSDVATALSVAGVPRLILPVTLALLALQMAWSWRHRRADPWVLAGMAAIVARLSTYHQPYDDMLLVVPILALARAAGPGSRRLPAVLAAAAAAALMLPPVPGEAALLCAPMAAWLGFEARRPAPAVP